MHRTTRTIFTGLAAAAALALLPGSALATPEDAGCEGLHDVAAFATFKHGDTPGHQQVHELFEARDCGHHH